VPRREILGSPCPQSCIALVLTGHNPAGTPPAVGPARNQMFVRWMIMQRSEWTCPSNRCRSVITAGGTCVGDKRLPVGMGGSLRTPPPRRPLPYTPLWPNLTMTHPCGGPLPKVDSSRIHRWLAGCGWFSRPGPRKAGEAGGGATLGWAIPFQPSPFFSQTPPLPIRCPAAGS
jgi:hypothetical protein